MSSIGASTNEETSVTIADLDAFAQAFNRHDLDTVMSFIADDAVFMSSAGPDVYGRRFEGKAAIRKAFEDHLAVYPDAQWNSPKHTICGSRGLTEWVFTGTRKDGTKIKTNGCDVFTFKSGKILVKDAFRKQP